MLASFGYEFIIGAGVEISSTTFVKNATPENRGANIKWTVASQVPREASPGSTRPTFEG